MLNTLRKGAGGIIAKIFMLLLVLSFAVWGIEDMLVGSSRSSLAEVGDTRISPEEFQRAEREELQAMSSQSGRQLTMSDGRAMGLQQRTMSRLIGGAAIDTHAKKLDLGISDEAIKGDVMRERVFQDKAGKFSQIKFQQILRANDLSEQGFLMQQREADIRKQLTQTVGALPTPPKTMIDALNRYEKETRTVRYILAPPAAAGEIGEPSPEELQRFYDNNKRIFTAPSYRKVAYVSLTPDTLPEKFEITDDELKAGYEATKDRLGKPERRKIQQIVFPDVASAQAAYDKIASGTDFMALAKERNLSETDIDLGMVQKSELADPMIAEEAFKLPEDQVSKPITGPLNTALIRVTEIAPGTVKLYEDAKDEIRKQLVANKSSAQILDLHDKVEDERASGASLAELAEKTKLSYTVIEAIDSQGRDPSGKTIETPKSDQFLTGVFQSDVGVENDPLELGDGGFVWYDVQGVTPEKLRPLDEVKDKVVEGWKRGAQRTKLAELGQKLIDRLRNGESFDEIAKSVGAEVKTTPPLTRSGGGELPASAVAQAFASLEGGSGSAASPDGQGRFIFQVATVTTPETTAPADAERLRNQIARLMGDDFVAQYVTGLQDSYGVSINQARLDQLTGAAEQ